MFIKSVHIKKFRGFENVSFNLGTNLTAIAGQNGTQKTTLLGVLSQPFTISDQENPMYGEKPLCGGNYKSLFSEKFKLSETFDTPQNHEWTLQINSKESPEFTMESIKRSSSNPKAIRFWKKDDRSRGSGYIQLPVIYLSLSRLFPIGEDIGINSSTNVSLSKDEFNFYRDWHNKILILPNLEVTTVDYLVSSQKNTLGVNTALYDWKMNSAGQDNIGKILLAILSFRRLKETHGETYKGGILAIDEIDATLYPASQVMLIDALRSFSSKFNIQIIFTTHSLHILEKACGWQEDQNLQGQVKAVYLQKIDSKIKALENIPFDVIENKLNVALSVQRATKKIPIFTEDKEGEIFFRALLKRRTSELEFVKCSLGCDNLIELSRKKIKGFKFPESLIVLDGDVKSEPFKMKRIGQLANVLILPGNKSIERLIAEFLESLSDESEIWGRIQNGYDKQFVFKEFSLSEIQKDRNKAKKWFTLQKQYWGRNSVNVINPWIDSHQQEVGIFIAQYEKMRGKYKNLLLN